MSMFYRYNSSGQTPDKQVQVLDDKRNIVLCFPNTMGDIAGIWGLVINHFHQTTPIPILLERLAISYCERYSIGLNPNNFISLMRILKIHLDSNLGPVKKVTKEHIACTIRKMRVGNYAI